MKSITINGSKRESVGKSSSKALRNAGQIPCVLYGGDGPIHFSAPELAFSKLVYTANAYTVVIALSDNESYSAVLQDIQFHPVSWFKEVCLVDNNKQVAWKYLIGVLLATYGAGTKSSLAYMYWKETSLFKNKLESHHDFVFSKWENN